MESMQRRLSRFIKQQVYNATRAGVCRELLLRHIVNDKVGPEVRRWEIDTHHQTESGVELLYTEVIAAAEGDATDNGGLQKYQLQSFHGENERPTGRFVIRVEGQTEEDTEGETLSEPATVKGQLAQSMRHTEAVLKQAVAGFAVSQNALARIVTEQSARLAHLENERINSFVTLEKLMSEQHERDMATRREDRRAAMLEGVAKQVTALLPIALKKATGADLVPAEYKAALTALLQNIEPERRAKFFELMTDAEKAFVLDVIQGASGDQPT